MVRKKITVMILSLILSGCASAQRKTVTKPVPEVTTLSTPRGVESIGDAYAEAAIRNYSKEEFDKAAQDFKRAYSSYIKGKITDKAGSSLVGRTFSLIQLGRLAEAIETFNLYTERISNYPLNTEAEIMFCLCKHLSGKSADCNISAFPELNSVFQ